MRTEAEIRADYKKLTELLIARNLTITTMESCTAGLVACLLTDTEGSSQILKGAFITYSNEAKQMQGVPAGVLENYGVYSPETACEMAKACRRQMKAQIGLGVTGTLGNADPANHDTVPGEVHLAVSCGDALCSRTYTLPPMQERYLYKLSVADLALQMLEEAVVKCIE